MEMLCFRLPGHGDTTLKHLNTLRSRQHFCDVTIVAGDNQTFRGHKVVLAACSPFLRDQFLLNPSSKLQVSMLYSAKVVCDLLQSCYTGVLQFDPGEIVNYLTAASYLQMEHIVERCRGALKKYMQLRNPSASRGISEQSPSRLVVVSGSVRSVASGSPPVDRSSPVRTEHGPVVQIKEEDGGGMSAQDSAYHHDNSPMRGEASLKVSGSDEDETRTEDYNVFRVYVSEERQTNREEDGVDPSSDEPPEVSFPETDVVVGGEGCEYVLNPAEDPLSPEGFTAEGLNAYRRRLSDPKTARGRSRSRGRGFKRRRWVSSQEKRAMGGVDQQQEMWCMAGVGGGYGMGYDPDTKTDGGYVPVVELPQLDYGRGEEVTPGAANNHSQYSMDDSNGGAGEGSSGGLANEGGGDESVAVVGSTSSSVSGPVICEHCGMTFPSALSLAVHSRSSHLLYGCPCCGKHFHHSANLTRHMAVHRGGPKSHQCPLCYKTFTQKSTLIDHMNLHSGERPHRCSYCHARFAHKPALRRHLKEQHGKTTGQNSLHEQEERERANEAAAAGAVREEEQECLVTEQGS